MIMDDYETCGNVLLNVRRFGNNLLQSCKVDPRVEIEDKLVTTET